MMYWKARKASRIPNQLAAVAALVLLITAFTEGNGPRGDEEPGADHARLAAVNTQAAENGKVAEPLSNSRPAARISKMLFRFN